MYDLEWVEKDGRKVSKIIFVMYAPDDNQDNQEKFVVACNKEQLKAKIPETNLDMQVNRWDDLDQDAAIKKFN